MFTPSLTTMMLHSFWSDFGIQTDRERFHNEDDFAKRIGEWFRRDRFKLQDMPRIPVIARVANLSTISGTVRSHVAIDERGPAGGVLVWGRIPLDRLLDHYLQNHARTAQQEIFDLGTPLINAAVTPGLSMEDQCETWLKQTDKNATKVHICIIDRGENAANRQPNDFDGFLTHAEKTDVVMSDHALSVLYALLERLDSFSLLPDCKIYCSLVKPPAKNVGKQCFEHANSTELVTALGKAQSLLSGVHEPVLFNLSMGTHAGPHNGASPLEIQVRNLIAAQNRFFFASAGNEGLKGVANRANLKADIQDTLRLHTGPAGREELLIEFWWQEPPQHTGLKLDVEFEVQLSIYDPVKKEFEPKFGTPLKIDTTTPVQLTTHLYQAQNVMCASLYERTCYSGMACGAFGLSTTPNTGGFPSMQIEVSLCSKGQPAVVNSWLVVSDDPGTAFLEGTKSGSLTLPASDRAVVSVGGVHRPQKALIPWAQASRGRASVYTDYTVSPPVPDESQRAPWVAHMVELPRTNEMGTSFASPRACADAAGLLLKPHIRGRNNTVGDIVAELLRLPTPLPVANWDERVGYGQLG